MRSKVNRQLELFFHVRFLVFGMVCPTFIPFIILFKSCLVSLQYFTSSLHDQSLSLPTSRYNSDQLCVCIDFLTTLFPNSFYHSLSAATGCNEMLLDVVVKEEVRVFHST